MLWKVKLCWRCKTRKEVSKEQGVPACEMASSVDLVIRGAITS